MAKPYLDQAGSGLHMHLSLQDKSGRNVFDGGAAPASVALEHAVGGVLDLLPGSMAFPGAQREFVPALPNPTSSCRSGALGVTRTARRRSGSHSVRARRGASSTGSPAPTPIPIWRSPHSSPVSHHGLTNKIAPPAAFEGNAGFAPDEGLPFRPRPALARLVESEVLADYFGREYPGLYAACKTAELDAFREPHRRPASTPGTCSRSEAGPPPRSLNPAEHHEKP